MIKAQQSRCHHQKINNKPLPLVHHVQPSSEQVLVIGQIEGIKYFFVKGSIWTDHRFVNVVVDSIFGEKKFLLMENGCFGI